MYQIKLGSAFWCSFPLNFVRLEIIGTILTVSSKLRAHNLHSHSQTAWVSVTVHLHIKNYVSVSQWLKVILVLVHQKNLSSWWDIWGKSRWTLYMSPFYLIQNRKDLWGAKASVYWQGQLFPWGGVCPLLCLQLVLMGCHRLGYAGTTKVNCNTAHSSWMGAGSFPSWEESL